MIVNWESHMTIRRLLRTWQVKLKIEVLPEDVHKTVQLGAKGIGKDKEKFLFKSNSVLSCEITQKALGLRD